ncbi:MAG: hypothetical protein ACK58T_32265, partial [Phycisphaerae bacterium]
MDNFSPGLKVLRSVESLLTWTGVLAASLGLGTAFFSAASALSPHVFDIRYSGLAVWIGSVAFTVGCFMFWWIVREAYWRSGSGLRVGLSFDSMRIDSAELERVRYAFRDLAKAGRANARVSFRAFPGPIARDPARVAAIQKKYKLDMYFSVDISPSTSDQHVRAYSLSVRHITTQKLDEDFHRLLISHLSHIHDRSKMPGSASDLARRDGEHLAELFLGVIAIVLFSSNRHDDALPLLAKLDNQLSARFEALEFPRRAFRLIWMRCLCTP